MAEKPSTTSKNTDLQKDKIFSELDEIFQEDPKNYVSTLIAIRDEFAYYQKKMIEAILIRNESEVSDIRHKITGTSFVLDHPSFYTLLKNVNGLEKISDEKLLTIKDKVRFGFEELIRVFDDKIKSISVSNKQ